MPVRRQIKQRKKNKKDKPIHNGRVCMTDESRKTNTPPSAPPPPRFMSPPLLRYTRNACAVIKTITSPKREAEPKLPPPPQKHDSQRKGATDERRKTNTPPLCVRPSSLPVADVVAVHTKCVRSDENDSPKREVSPKLTPPPPPIQGRS